MLCRFTLLIVFSTAAVVGTEATAQESAADQLSREGLQAHLQERYEYAIHAYSRSLEERVQAETYVARAHARVHCADYEGALADCESALELDANLVGARFIRASALLATKQFGPAIEECDQVIEAGGSLTEDAYRFRAAARQQTGDLDGAISDLTTFITSNTDPVKALMARAKLLYERGDINLAIADYNRVIEIDAQFASAYAGRGAARIKAGHPDTALADLTHAIELDDNSVEAFFLRAALWIDNGEISKAIEDVGRVIQVEPNYVKAREFRALCLHAVHEPLAAIADCDWMIELESSAENYALRGRIKHETDDYEGARRDFEKALEIDPEHPDAMTSLAAIIISDDAADHADYRRALKLAQRGWEIGKGNKHAWRHLAVLASAQAKLGDFEQAIENQERSLLLSPEEHHHELQRRLDTYRTSKVQ